MTTPQDSATVKHSPSKPWLWQPGQSGNPKGRAPGHSLADLCRVQTQDGAIPVHLLVDVCLGKVKGAKAADRINAANSLLDRAFGRPVQAVAHGGPEGGPIPVALGLSQLSDAELIDFIRRGMRSLVVEGVTAALSDGDEKEA